MSAGPARAAAFDGTRRAALLLLLALRLAEFALLDDAAFDPSSESLADLFFATTNSSLASFGLVPMALLLGSPVLSLASSAPVTVRLGRRGHVALCLRAVALRAVLFSAVVVGSGLLLVAARGYWVFDAGGALGFAAREALLMSLFFDACQVVMLLVWLAGSSLPTALCAGACYGVVDQLASFSRTPVRPTVPRRLVPRVSRFGRLPRHLFPQRATAPCHRHPAEPCLWVGHVPARSARPRR